VNVNAFLSEETKITKVADAAAADTTAVTGASVDMDGWDGVLFLTSLGTAAANNAMHAEQSADDSAFADLEGSEVDVGASDEDQFIDIQRPSDRYVRPVVLRGTSSACGDVWAIQYRGSQVPQSNVTSGTINGKQLVSPAEGTK